MGQIELDTGYARLAISVEIKDDLSGIGIEVPPQQLAEKTVGKDIPGAKYLEVETAGSAAFFRIEKFPELVYKLGPAP